MKSPRHIFIGFTTLFIALSAWAAVEPSHLNWGVHSAAFFGIGVQVLVLAMALALLVPAVQTKLVAAVDRWGTAGEKGAWKWMLALFAAISVGCWLLFPAKLHLLGDGAILLRSIPGYESMPGIPASFRNQPLMWIVFRACELVLGLFMSPSPHDVYVALDILGGLLLLAVIAWAMKRIDRPAGERILLGALLMFGGGYQFFFGYVENYVLQYVATAAYAVSGWLAIEKKVRPWVPAILFVLMVGLHLGDIVYLPSLLYFAAASREMDFRKNRGKILLAGIGTVVVAIGMLTGMGFNIAAFAGHFLNGSPDFLPLIGGSADYYPYSLFSGWHFLDWVNGLFRVAPFALALTIIPLLVGRTERLWTRPAFLFLVVTAAGGFVFTWFVNSALGLARDWDLFSSFFVPLMVLDVYLFSKITTLDGRKPILLVAAALSMLHLALRVGINSDADKHLARMEMLDSPKLLSVSARLFHDEALANYYYDDGQYDRARLHYERYLRSGTLNPRVFANLSDCYRKLDMKEQYFTILKKAAEIGSTNPGVYSNLAVEYVTRGDTAMAIWMNRKCIGMDSAQVQAYANLSIVYLNADKPDSSLQTARLAMQYGFNDPVIWRVMGKAQIKMGHYADAVGSYDRYLTVNPNDAAIREQRNRLAVAARQLGQMQ